MGFVVLLILILILIWWLWSIIFSEKARAAKMERERLAAERRAEQEARLAKEKAEVQAQARELEAERDSYLKLVRSNVPDFILKARMEFEREYRSKGGEGMFGQEMSPLVCFGYRVGKTAGRTETERRKILEYAIAADYDATLPFLPQSYRNDWGAALSVTRFNRIYQHLNSMADLRDGRRNFEVAVSQWRSDASWFHNQTRSKVERYRAI